MPRTAWLEVDLGRVASNLRAIRATVPEGTAVWPIVKADAYGHGALPVSHALRAAGADGLGVATFDEAVELRRGGLRLPILVLYGPPPDAAGKAARLGIEIAVDDPAILERTLAAFRRRRSSTEPARRLRLHLQVETGLGRAGLAVADLQPAARLILAAAGVELAGVWSHLGSAEDSMRTDEQAGRFGLATDLLAQAGLRVPVRHLAASGALIAATAPAFDLVRPGLAIYGIVPDGLPPSSWIGSIAGDLRPVAALRARPTRVADLPAGTTISYGAAFVTDRPSRIATLPLGYADGYARALTNRAFALVRGCRVPVVGTVAMDGIMVDVTDVSGPPVDVDDEFVLLGEQDGDRISAIEMAQWRTTISYEVLAVMARRLPRVYHSAPELLGMRTLTDEKGPWLGSSSGTATSAISKSTRSSTQPTSRSGWRRESAAR